eukprot:TRINITY_DN2045_c0_g1_i1.p1 TRINITY_DN2045_c0_g1~~TRINITY_DN2045_c0_g1_i1.p1  ORF type:complete len:326 (+),score=70.16 TRINITY_DN2045_c0_g1_i1:61-1038(+)
MKPLILKGHQRPLTCVKYNYDGDLIFTSARDNEPNVWYSETGKRLGTYIGHQGAVLNLDVTHDSSRLATASADNSAKLWEVKTGKCLFTFPHGAPVRGIAFNHGDTCFATIQDNKIQQKALISVYKHEEDLANQTDEPILKIQGDCLFTRIAWGPTNDTLFVGREDGYLQVFDAETGSLLESEKVHDKAIKDIQFSKDYGLVLTASSDQTAKLIDSSTLEVKKVYKSDAPVNSAVFSPLYTQILIGGGQEARDVTTSSHKSGRFAARFFHMIDGIELGMVNDHFGPINSLSFSPDGTQYTSGGEEGYIRLHKFDPSYFTKSQRYD